jgi:hypothetical protein
MHEEGSKHPYPFLGHTLRTPFQDQFWKAGHSSVWAQSG